MSNVLLFSNNGSSTLAGPLTNVSTTVNLAAGSGILFPTPSAGQSFRLTLIDAATGLVTEILNVTARNGDVLTVQRAQEGTSAENWLAGDIAANVNTAGTMEAFAQSVGISSQFYQGTDNGTGNVVTVPSLTPTLSIPLASQVFLITKGPDGSAGPVQMSIGGGTQYEVVYKDGSQLNTGDWPANSAAFLYFTGSVYQYMANMANIPLSSVVRIGSATTGTATALATTLIPPPPADPTTNFLFTAPITTTNGPATTISLGGSAISILNNRTGAALIGSEAPGAQGFVGLFFYNGTNVLLLNAVPAAPSAANVVIYTLQAQQNIATYTQTTVNVAGAADPAWARSSNGVVTILQAGYYNVSCQVEIQGSSAASITVGGCNMTLNIGALALQTGMGIPFNYGYESGPGMSLSVTRYIPANTNVSFSALLGLYASNSTPYFSSAFLNIAKQS